MNFYKYGRKPDHFSLAYNCVEESIPVCTESLSAKLTCTEVQLLGSLACLLSVWRRSDRYFTETSGWLSDSTGCCRTVL